MIKLPSISVVRSVNLIQVDGFRTEIDMGYVSHCQHCIQCFGTKALEITASEVGSTVSKMGNRQPRREG